jgi:hypothetical protein
VIDLGLDGGALTSRDLIGRSSGCASEELSEGGVVKELMSSAEDNSVVPYAGIAQSPGAKSKVRKPVRLCLFEPFHVLSWASPFAMVQTYRVPH